MVTLTVEQLQQWKSLHKLPNFIFKYKSFPLLQFQHRKGNRNFHISPSLEENDQNGVMKCTLPDLMALNSMMSAKILKNKN